MKTKQVIVVAAAVLASVTAVAWAVVGGRAGVQYRTVRVERGDVNVTVSSTGSPNAVVTVQVGSQVSGVILALFADFNTKVTKGQLIARIDPAPFQAKVDQAQANLLASSASVANAQAVVQQAQASIQAANSALTAAQANVAKAQVQQFTAALVSAQLDLDHTKITAPVDGVVVSRNVDVGQTVAASLAAPTLFLIAQDLTKMQVDTNVSEADVGRVQVDQPATFTVDAYPAQVFKGVVTSIRKAPINVQNVITYDAVISVSNVDLKLFPGMTANVKILVNQRPNVIRVPNAALRYHPASETPAAGGKDRRSGAAAEKAVWILDANSKPQRVSVTTGETDGSYTEITGGDLKVGDRVIIAALAKGPAASGGVPGSQPGNKGGRGPGF